MFFANCDAWYASASPSSRPNCFNADARIRPGPPALPKTPGRIVVDGCGPVWVRATSFFAYTTAFAKSILGNRVPPLRPPFGIFLVPPPSDGLLLGDLAS